MCPFPKNTKLLNIDFCNAVEIGRRLFKIFGKLKKGFFQGIFGNWKIRRFLINDAILAHKKMLASEECEIIWPS